MEHALFYSNTDMAYCLNALGVPFNTEYQAPSMFHVTSALFELYLHHGLPGTRRLLGDYHDFTYRAAKGKAGRSTLERFQQISARMEELYERSLGFRR